MICQEYGEYQAVPRKFGALNQLLRSYDRNSSIANGWGLASLARRVHFILAKRREMNRRWRR